MNEPISIPGFQNPFSSFSHLAGAVIFAALSVRLMSRVEGSLSKKLALGVFCFASVFLLSMSGVYHLLPLRGTARMVLQRLDHSAIVILIVGTLTPVHQILFRGWMQWGWLLGAWAIALSALTLKNVYFSSFPEWLGLLVFLSLGWGGAVSCALLWRRNDLRFILPLIGGGVAYTLGAVLEFASLPVLIRGVVGPHEMFHVAVLIGLGLHWKFISRISGVDPAVKKDITS